MYIETEEKEDKKRIKQETNTHKQNIHVFSIYKSYTNIIVYKFPLFEGQIGEGKIERNIIQVNIGKDNL